MLAAPFAGGVGIYVFYAAQPYLLQLFGDPNAYGIAGLVAALVAGAQIVGGLLVHRVRNLFHRRTDALLLAGILTSGLLVLVGLTTNFAIALVLLAISSLVFAFESPIRQTFINGLIPSEQRATVLSFDSLMSSAGGVVAQPALGRVADVWGYGASYVIGGAVSAIVVPFIWLSRRERAPSDPISPTEAAG
jgi:MFS family permease